VPIRAGGRLSTRQTLDEYLSSLELRPSAASLARAALPLFFAHLEGLGVDDLRAVREEHLASYARQLRTVKGKRGRIATISTQRSFLSTVRGLFAFLEKRGLILRDPSRDLVMPRAERLPRAVPSEAQVRRLLQAPFPGSMRGLRDRAILEVLYATGLRVSECVRLDVVDLDLAEGTLLVRDGKGKKDRVVPVGGRAALALELYLRDARPLFRRSSHEQALFLSTLGGRLTRSAVEARVRALQKAVASPVWISPHVLRHACATHLLRGGADVRHVQELLGHKRLETTALYTRVNVQDLAAVLAKAHPRERAWSRSRRQRDRIASS
jgi:integrase/recombinase XerD